MPVTIPQRVTSVSTVGSTFAGIALTQAIVTSGSDQYVAYYNETSQLTIAYRTITSSTWTTQVIAGADATVGWDSHNIIVMALDSTGNLHVAANMHANSLRYWRTSTPRDLTTLTRIPVMVNATWEAAVTSPAFLTLSDGSLTFNYRDGYSGNGSNYFYKYDATTQTWTALNNGAIFNGEGTRSVYYSVTPGQGGFFDVVFMWRSSGDVSTNSRLSYMRTRDFVNWQAMSGAPVTLPVTYNTPGVVVDNVPEGGGLFNGQPQVGADATGDITISYTKYDATGATQLYVARYGGGNTWWVNQITHWTGRWDVSGTGSMAMAVSVSGVSAQSDRNLAISFMCNGAHRTIVMNGSLVPLAELPFASGQPGAIYQTQSTYPGIGTRTIMNQVSPSTYFVLKWDSLGSNGDVARTAFPSAQPLTVYQIDNATPPTAPQGLAATTTSVTLKWSGPADSGGAGVTGFRVQYSPDAGTTWIMPWGMPITASTLTISGLSPTIHYLFRVSAVNQVGWGAWQLLTP